MVNCLAQAEARAEFAERSVQKLQKEVDRLEGNRIDCVVRWIKIVMIIIFNCR